MLDGKKVQRQQFGYTRAEKKLQEPQTNWEK